MKITPKPLPHDSGISILDALVGIAITTLGFFILSVLSLNAKKGTVDVEVDLLKMQVAETYGSLIKNTLGWNQTVSRAPVLKDYLESSSPLPSVSSSKLAIYDGTGALNVPALGKYIHMDGSTGAAGDKNLGFLITATWSSFPPHSAIVELRVKYIGPNLESQKRADTIVKIFRNPIPLKRCIEVEAPVVAGSSGAQGDFNYVYIPYNTSLATDPGANNFVYDEAKVSCPNDYYLSLVYLRRGCNSLTGRTFALPSDPRVGTCHQISAQTPLQRTGCSAGSEDGVCVARCCNFN